MTQDETTPGAPAPAPEPEPTRWTARDAVEFLERAMAFLALHGAYRPTGPADQNYTKVDVPALEASLVLQRIAPNRFVIDAEIAGDPGGRFSAETIHRLPPALLPTACNVIVRYLGDVAEWYEDQAVAFAREVSAGGWLHAYRSEKNNQ